MALRPLKPSKQKRKDKDKKQPPPNEGGAGVLPNVVGVPPPLLPVKVAAAPSATSVMMRRR